MKNKALPTELRAEEWIKKANDDELNARSILTHRDGTPNGVCFLSHQTTEKYLKSFLVFKKEWFPKIHALDTLTELCEEIDSSFKELEEDAIFLNAFYTPARYPGDYPEYSWKEAEKAFAAAQRIKAFCLNKIHAKK